MGKKCVLDSGFKLVKVPLSCRKQHSITSEHTHGTRTWKIFIKRRPLHRVILRVSSNTSYGVCQSLVTHSLRWRHNERDGVLNHQPHDCLLNRLFRHRWKKTSKIRVTGLCEGNSPVTGEFPAQRASYAENVPIWWRYHGLWCVRGLLNQLCSVHGVPMCVE